MNKTVDPDNRLKKAAAIMGPSAVQSFGDNSLDTR